MVEMEDSFLVSAFLLLMVPTTAVCESGCAAAVLPVISQTCTYSYSPGQSKPQ